MFLRKLSKNRENMIYFQIRLSSDTSSSQDVLIALLLVYYRINLKSEFMRNASLPDGNYTTTSLALALTAVMNSTLS